MPSLTLIRSLLRLVLLLIICPTVYASAHPDTSKQFLKEHGIPITIQGLTGALRNADPEIRGIAAQTLANEKMTEAAPMVADAVRNEKDLDLRVNLAYALAQLGDSEGFAFLRQFCNTDPVRPRIKAAGYLLEKGDESCWVAIEGVLESDEKTSGFIVQALSLVPGFRKIPAAEQERLFRLVISRLSDPDPFVRLTAGDVLRRLGNVNAIPALEESIANEPDQNFRSTLQADLDKLKSKLSR